MTTMDTADPLAQFSDEEKAITRRLYTAHKAGQPLDGFSPAEKETARRVYSAWKSGSPANPVAPTGPDTAALAAGMESSRAYGGGLSDAARGMPYGPSGVKPAPTATEMLSPNADARERALAALHDRPDLAQFYRGEGARDAREVEARQSIHPEQVPLNWRTPGQTISPTQPTGGNQQAIIAQMEQERFREGTPMSTPERFVQGLVNAPLQVARSAVGLVTDPLASAIAPRAVIDAKDRSDAGAEAQFGPRGLAGRIGSGIGQVAVAAPLAAVGGLGAGAGVLAASSAEQGYQDYIQNVGRDRASIAKALAVGGFYGAAEYVAERIGLGAILRETGTRGGLQAVKGALRAAGVNASEEMLTQVAQNAVSKYSYDPGRSLTEGVGEAGLIGGVSGGVAHGTLHAGGEHQATYSDLEQLKAAPRAPIGRGTENIAQVPDGAGPPAPTDTNLHQPAPAAAGAGGYTLKDLGRSTEAARGTGGISSEVRDQGLVPAFRDGETGKVYPSKYPPGWANKGDPERPAGVHIMDGLPDEVVVTRDVTDPQTVLAVKPSIEPGFTDAAGKFFTRDEASARTGTTHTNPHQSTPSPTDGDPYPRARAILDELGVPDSGEVADRLGITLPEADRLVGRWESEAASASPPSPSLRDQSSNAQGTPRSSEEAQPASPSRTGPTERNSPTSQAETTAPSAQDQATREQLQTQAARRSEADTAAQDQAGTGGQNPSTNSTRPALGSSRLGIPLDVVSEAQRQRDAARENIARQSRPFAPPGRAVETERRSVMNRVRNPDTAGYSMEGSLTPEGVIPRGDRSHIPPRVKPDTGSVGFVKGGETTAGPERIVAAAVQDTAGRVYRGNIHADAWDAYTRANTDNPNVKLADSEGFVTSTGRYVDRYEAARIAGTASKTAKAEDFGRFVTGPNGASVFQWNAPPFSPPSAAARSTAGGEEAKAAAGEKMFTELAQMAGRMKVRQEAFLAEQGLTLDQARAMTPKQQAALNAKWKAYNEKVSPVGAADAASAESSQTRPAVRTPTDAKASSSRSSVEGTREGRQPWEMTKQEFRKAAPWFHGTARESATAIEREGFKPATGYNTGDRPQRNIGPGEGESVWLGGKRLAARYAVTPPDWAPTVEGPHKGANRKGGIVPVAIRADAVEGTDYRVIREHGQSVVEVLRRDAVETHRQSVERALSAGRPVPAEVLKDYPELGGKKEAETKPSKTAAAEAIIDRSNGIRAKLAEQIGRYKRPALWIDHQLIREDGKYEYQDGKLVKVQDLNGAGFVKNVQTVMGAEGNGKWWGMNDEAKALAGRLSESARVRQEKADAEKAASEAKDKAEREARNARMESVDAAYNAAKFKPASITMPDGSTVTGPSYKGLIVWKAPDRNGAWNINHVESGKNILRGIDTREYAKRVVVRMTDLTDWTQPEKALVQIPDMPRRVRAIREDRYADITPEPTPPSTLSKVATFAAKKAAEVVDASAGTPAGSMPAAIRELLAAGPRAAAAIRERITNVRPGKVTDTAEHVRFTLDGKNYELPMTGRNRDLVLTGDKTKDAAIATRVLLDSDITPKPSRLARLADTAAKKAAALKAAPDIRQAGKGFKGKGGRAGASDLGRVASYAAWKAVEGAIRLADTVQGYAEKGIRITREMAEDAIRRFKGSHDPAEVMRIGNRMIRAATNKDGTIDPHKLELARAEAISRAVDEAPEPTQAQRDRQQQKAVNTAAAIERGKGQDSAAVREGMALRAGTAKGKIKLGEQAEAHREAMQAQREAFADKLDELRAQKAVGLDVRREIVKLAKEKLDPADRFRILDFLAGADFKNPTKSKADVTRDILAGATRILHLADTAAERRSKAELRAIVGKASKPSTGPKLSGELNASLGVKGEPKKLAHGTVNARDVAQLRTPVRDALTEVVDSLRNDHTTGAGKLADFLEKQGTAEADMSVGVSDYFSAEELARIKALDNKLSDDLTPDERTLLGNAIKHAAHLSAEGDKFQVGSEKRAFGEVKAKTIEEVKARGKEASNPQRSYDNGAGKLLQSAKELVTTDQMDLSRMLGTVAGQDSTLHDTAYKALADGESAQKVLVREAMAKSGLHDWKAADIARVNQRRTVKLSSGVQQLRGWEMMEILGHYMDPSTQHEIEQAPFLRKDDASKHKEKSFFATREDLATIESMLTAKERAAVPKLHDALKLVYRKANDAHEDLLGFRLPDQPYHWSRVRDRGPRNEGTEARVARQTRFEDSGMYKERTGSKEPIVLRNPFEWVPEAIHQHAGMATLARPMRNVRRLLNDPEVRSALTTAGGDNFLRKAEGRIAELVPAPGSGDGTDVNRVMQGLLGRYASAKLAFRISSVAKQRLGMFQAASVAEDAGLAARLTAEAFKPLPILPAEANRLREEINPRSGILAERADPAFAATLQSAANPHLKVATTRIGQMWNAVERVGLAGLQAADSGVVLRTYRSVRAHLEGQGFDGTDLIDRAVRLTEQIIRNSQNPTSPLDMSGLNLAGRKNPWLGAALMFTSSANKMRNIMVQSISDARADPSAKNLGKLAKVTALTGANAIAEYYVGLATGGAAIGAAASAISGGDDERKKIGMAQKVLANLADVVQPGAGDAIRTAVSPDQSGTGVGKAIMAARSVMKAADDEKLRGSDFAVRVINGARLLLPIVPDAPLDYAQNIIRGVAGSEMTNQAGGIKAALQRGDDASLMQAQDRIEKYVAGRLAQPPKDFTRPEPEARRRREILTALRGNLERQSGTRFDKLSDEQERRLRAMPADQRPEWYQDERVRFEEWKKRVDAIVPRR